jgi:SAM-dependent methyltransferase
LPRERSDVDHQQYIVEGRKRKGGVSLTGYEPARYGETVGDSYDSLYPGVDGETAAAVEFLAALARTRPECSVLEFGIGTGRLALPLHRMGVKVAGVDGSERMVAQLRQKLNGSEIDVVIGDYRNTRVGRSSFSVVLLAINGVFDPRGLAAQLDIFRNAACHLAPGGYFVVESWVMTDVQRTAGWSVMPRYVSEQHVELQLARYDIASNSIERTLVHLRQSGLEFVTVTDTYASPGELDVMAAATGFERHARYGAWGGAEYTVTSRNHISVYRRRVGG